MTLDDALEMFAVEDVSGMDDLTMQQQSISGWFAVSDDTGIIAYFGNEVDAFRFRLAEINRKLNG